MKKSFSKTLIMPSIIGLLFIAGCIDTLADAENKMFGYMSLTHALSMGIILSAFITYINIKSDFSKSVTLNTLLFILSAGALQVPIFALYKKINIHWDRSPGIEKFVRVISKTDKKREYLKYAFLLEISPGVFDEIIVNEIAFERIEPDMMIPAIFFTGALGVPWMHLHPGVAGPMPIK